MGRTLAVHLPMKSCARRVRKRTASQSLHGGELMNKASISNLSRRNFIVVAGSAAAAVAFAPRFLFAETKGIVATMIDATASTPITTHPLRRNISVLEGSGGNIAVLTGKEG